MLRNSGLLLLSVATSSSYSLRKSSTEAPPRKIPTNLRVVTSQSSAPLLEPRVPSEADTGERRELLASKSARHPSCSARKPCDLRSYRRAVSAQKVLQFRSARAPFHGRVQGSTASTSAPGG